MNLNRTRKLLLLLGFLTMCCSPIWSQVTVSGLQSTNLSPGDQLVIQGSGFAAAGACDTVIIEQISGGTYLDTLFGANGDFVVGGGGTSLSFALDLGITCGSFEVNYQGNPMCVGGNQTPPVQVFLVSDSISFDYGLDSMFCQADTNPLPVLNTTHSVLPSYRVINPGNALINPNTGELFLPSFFPNNYQVVATTAGTACTDSDTATIVVAELTQGYMLSYDPDSSCGNNQTNMLPLFPVPDSLGTFTATPMGLVFVNSDSGRINVSASTPGEYVVRYDPNPDLCFSTVYDTIKILDVPTPSFFFDSLYCLGQGVIFPNITVAPPTTGNNIFGSQANAPFSDALPGSAFNTSTGAIDLSDPNLTDTVYCLTNTVFGLGVCQTSFTACFRTKNPPDPSFVLQDTFCSTSGVVTPSSVADLSGNFYDTLTVNTLDITNANTGEININASSQGGPFSLFHKVDSGFCVDSFEVQLYILDPASADVGYPKQAYCKNEPNPTPIFLSGSLGGVFESDPFLPPTVLNDSTGELDLSSPLIQDTTYAITYTFQIDTCSSVTLVDSLVISSSFNFDFSLPADTFCQLGGIEGITLIGGPVPAGVNITYSLFLGANDYTADGIVGTTLDSLSTDSLPPGSNYLLIQEYTSGSCSDTVGHFFNLLERSDASFEYLDDVYCSNGDDPIPFITGTTGGFFTSATLFSGGSSTLNFINGEIDVSLSPDTIHVINYQVGDDCPSVGADTITIVGVEAAEFTLPTVTPCTDRDSLIPGRNNNLPGTWSIVTDSGGVCIIDTTNGIIEMDSCQPGRYTITLELDSTAGSCELDFSRSILVTPHDTSARMNYPVFSYCPSQDTAVPSFNVADTLNFLFPGIAGLVFANDSGVVDLERSTAGIYAIELQVEGDCPLVFQDTIEILDYTDPSFQLGDGSTNFFCTTDDPPLVVPESPGGIFTLQTQNLAFVPNWINATTGEISLDSIPDNSVSPMQICYNPGTSCTFDFCEIITINLGPEDAVINITPPRDTICAGDSIAFGLNGGESAIWFLDSVRITDPDQLSAADLVFRPNPDSLSQDFVVSVQVGDASNCNARIDTTITVNPVPILQFEDVPTLVSSNTFVDIDVSSPGVNNVFFDWVASSIGQVNFSPPDGRDGPVGLGQTGVVSSLIELADEGSPAQIIFTITPNTNECEGVEYDTLIQVNPVEFPIFVPEVFTPNGDFINDTWQIQWRSDFPLELYTMEVFNRSGAQVFSMSPVTPDWDGGTLPDGVYWWKLLDENRQKVLSGGVTIRRK